MIQKSGISKYVACLLLLAMLVPLCMVMPATEAYAKSDGIVTASELYMRTGPGTEYENVTYDDGTRIVLKKDQAVTILKRVEGADREWFKIRVKLDGVKYEGYSAADYISKVEKDSPEVTAAPTPTPTPTPTPSGETAAEQKYDYEHPAVTTASVLTLREGAGTSKTRITTLPRDTEVRVVGSKMIKLKDKTQQRWYLITVEVDGSTLEGYVLSDYVKLTFKTSIPAAMKQGDVKLCSKASASSKKVRDKNDEIILLDNKTQVTVLSETTKSGVKWFRIKVKYNGKNYKGYVPALTLKFVSAQAAASTPAPTPEPTPTVKPDPAEELPDVTPTINPDLDLAGGNAIIKDAAALAVKTSPEYKAGAVMTSEGTPVLLYSGQAVEVLDATAHDNVTWCYVRFLYDSVEYYGYISAKYIESDEPLDLMSSGGNASGGEMDFAMKLEQQSFPESYRALLVQLHQLYPNWEFKAFHTGLDWQDVIENESTVGKNLIQNSKGVEWKSLESGAYSWKTDSFVVFDGSSWVTASDEAIAYYMDPRNFLTADGIFQFEVLTYNPSYQTSDGVDNILNNTAMYGSSYTYPDELGNSRTISYTDTFMMAAEYSGVSPFHLASRVKQEVTLGTTGFSNSVSGTVAGLEGFYNFYNIGASHSTVAGGNIANGLNFAKNGSSSASLNTNCLIPWSNSFKSIVGGSFYIGNNYINRGQDTIYLQKFNVTQTDTFFHQYMANVEAPCSEGKRVYQAYTDPYSLPIVFSIPVYLNMPEVPSPLPEKAYNPNNWLKTLTLTDALGNELALTPTFSYTKDQEYSLIVDGNTDMVNFTATTVSKLANIISSPQVYLNEGLNSVSIQVMAENGDIREYIINIVRDSNAAAEQSSNGDETTVYGTPVN